MIDGTKYFNHGWSQFKRFCVESTGRKRELYFKETNTNNSEPVMGIDGDGISFTGG